MKNLLVLDLDNTLFQSTKLREEIYEKIGSLLSGKNYSKAEIVALCNSVGKEMIARLGYFSPDIFLEGLSKKIDISTHKKHMREIIFDTEFSKGFMHSDVLSVLKTLCDTVDLAILSQGEKEFQRSKLDSISYFFPKNDIHFEKDKKLEMKRIFGSYSAGVIYYVDDMLPMLAHAKKSDTRVVTVWMKRGPYAEKETTQIYKPDAIITRLTELISIVKQ